MSATDGIMSAVTVREVEEMAETAQSEEAPTGLIRVLVADDHGLYRRGLEMVLSQEPDIEVVGEACDGLEAIERAAELVPDIVLMDVRMPRRSGIEACQEIRDLVPSARIVMLTVSDEENDLFEAVRAGANGYLLKSVMAEEITDALRAVLSGASLITPSMASKLLSEFTNLSRQQELHPSTTVPSPRLTRRETEVLQLVARGMSNAEIADTLFISENTVKTHVRNVLDKLQMHSRMEAAMYAVRAHLVDFPD
jgi:DNA-binding NarL/FixJ family response regulator